MDCINLIKLILTCLYKQKLPRKLLFLWFKNPITGGENVKNAEASIKGEGYKVLKIYEDLFFTNKPIS